MLLLDDVALFEVVWLFVLDTFECGIDDGIASFLVGVTFVLTSVPNAIPFEFLLRMLPLYVYVFILAGNLGQISLGFGIGFGFGFGFGFGIGFTFASKPFLLPILVAFIPCDCGPKLYIQSNLRLVLTRTQKTNYFDECTFD